MILTTFAACSLVSLWDCMQKDVGIVTCTLCNIEWHLHTPEAMITRYASIGEGKQHVIVQEGVVCDASGLEALTFTADGDMRQGINNLQATAAGFGFVNQARPSRLHTSTCPAPVAWTAPVA